MLSASSAFAADILNNEEAVNFELVGGDLQIISSGDFVFADVIIADLDWLGLPVITETPTNVPQFELRDYRGTGAGWHVTFECTALNNGSHANSFELAYEQLGASITPEDGALTGPELQTVNAPDMHDAQTVIVTETGEGMGRYTFAVDEPDFGIDIAPDNAFAGVYSGNFTASIASGPGTSGGVNFTIE